MPLKRVLVVDDEPDIRIIVGQVLRDAGYAVLSAANGAEALERMRRDVPHGVVLDLHMPIMDGEAFLRACRADPALAEVPVAVITAEHNPGLLAETLRVQACIPKPFDLDELLEIVDRLFSDPDGLSEAEQSTEAAVWWRYPPDLHQRRIAEMTRAEAVSLARHTEDTLKELTRGRDVSAAAVGCLARARSRLESSRLVLSVASIC